ncbi:MAG: zf-HC2 domain-containing protein [Acidobacteria bacterium]|nr:zf-HC2 domain-containing protein [Acidobacteriota bacterium]
MTCEQLEPLLAPYADGELPAAEQARVLAHLHICASCRRAVDIQQQVRETLSARRSGLADSAPPGLRTRLAARLAGERAPVVDPGWRTRLSAFAAAALVVLAVGAVALPIVTERSTVVLAAQMALDHLKCFTIDGHVHDEPITEADAEAELLREYGWQLDVPPTLGPEGGRLVAVRRCLYGDGRAAHLLYRVDGAPVSLFILPGLERPAESLTMLGHAEVVWTADGRTYLMVGPEGERNRLMRMASHLQNGAE